MSDGGTNHLLHSTLPRGTMLELAPDKIEMGQLEDGGYAFEFADTFGKLNVRILLSAGEFAKLIEGAAAALESRDETIGNGGRGKVDVVRSMPRLSRMDVPRKR